MFFSKSAFVAAGVAAVALMSAQPARAADDRQLVSHASESGTDFCNTWRCNCINYVPNDKSLYFQGALCEPGNFQGQNTNTEAKVYCNFTNGSKTVSVIHHVAAASGATVEN